MKVGKKILVGLVVAAFFVGMIFLASAQNANAFDTKVNALLQQPAGEELYNASLPLEAEREGLSKVATIFVNDAQFQDLQEKVNADIAEHAAALTAQIDALEVPEAFTSEDQYRDCLHAANDLKLGDTPYETAICQQVENYDRIETYQEDLKDLLSTYEETCESCSGRGSYSCSSCSGGGRKTCSYCDGRGIKVVTWYSEGDWGEKSYTSYDCTYCDGSGRQRCSYCNGGSQDCGDCNGGIIYVFS